MRELLLSPSNIEFIVNFTNVSDEKLTEQLIYYLTIDWTIAIIDILGKEISSAFEFPS
jgi:hypothetical protein